MSPFLPLGLPNPDIIINQTDTCLSKWLQEKTGIYTAPVFPAQVFKNYRDQKMKLCLYVETNIYPQAEG